MCSAWSHTALGNGSKDSAVVVAALEAQRDCAQERALRVLLPAHGSSHTQGFRTPEEAVQLRARISWQPCHILGAPQEFPISPRRHCRSSSWRGRHQEPAGAHRPCCASLDSFPSLLSFWSNVNVMSSRGLYRYSLWVLIWDLYREQEPRGSPVLQWLEAQAPSAPAAEGGWRCARAGEQQPSSAGQVLEKRLVVCQGSCQESETMSSLSGSRSQLPSEPTVTAPLHPCPWRAAAAAFLRRKRPSDMGQVLRVVH